MVFYTYRLSPSWGISNSAAGAGPPSPPLSPFSSYSFSLYFRPRIDTESFTQSFRFELEGSDQEDDKSEEPTAGGHRRGEMHLGQSR
jgi:hypothetical protein